MGTRHLTHIANSDLPRAAPLANGDLQTARGIAAGVAMGIGIWAMFLMAVFFFLR